MFLCRVLVYINLCCVFVLVYFNLIFFSFLVYFILIWLINVFFAWLPEMIIFALKQKFECVQLDYCKEVTKTD